MLPFLLVCVIAALLTTICWALGTGVLVLTKITALPALFGVFLRLVLGLSTMVAGYALVRTSSNSVLLGLVLLLGGMLWQMRQTGPDATHSSLASAPLATVSAAPLGLAVVAAVLLTALRFPLLYNFSTGYFDAPFLDLAYYAKLTFPLNGQGIETIMLEPTALIHPTPVPYHYFELWLNALLEWATPLAPGVTLFVSTYSFLITLVFFGYCALFEHFGQPRLRALLLGGLCLFVAGVFLPGFGKSVLLLNSTFAWLPYLIVFPKLAPVYIFMLLGFLLYVRGQRVAAFWAWAVMPLVFISTAPAVYGSLGLLATGLVVTGRRGWGYWLRLFFPITAGASFIGIFYLINAWANPQPTVTPFGSGLDTMLPQAGEWGTSMRVVVGGVLAFGAYYFLYMLVLLLLARPRWRQVIYEVKPYTGLLVFVAGFFAIGLPLWGLGYHFLDAWQFFNNATMVGVAVLFATFLAVLLRKAGPQRAYAAAGAIAVLIGLNLYSAGGKLPMHTTTAYSPDFLRQVHALLPSLSPTGACLLGPNDYNGPYAYNAYTRTPGLYLSTLDENSRVLLNISQLNVSISQAVQSAPKYAHQVTGYIKNTQIQYFARQLRSRQSNLNNEQVQHDFVLSQGLNFVCASPGSKLPDSLRSLVQQELEDPQTHERLYVLNIK